MLADVWIDNRREAANFNTSCSCQPLEKQTSGTQEVNCAAKNTLHHFTGDFSPSGDSVQQAVAERKTNIVSSPFSTVVKNDAPASENGPVGRLDVKFVLAARLNAEERKAAVRTDTADVSQLFVSDRWFSRAHWFHKGQRFTNIKQSKTINRHKL